MERSFTYLELEELITRYWREKSLYEIIQLLEEAENDKQIDAAERDALLALYIAKHG